MFTGNTDPYQRYRQTRVETAGPLKLIIMMYEGALRFINLAKKAIEERDFMSANASLQRAQAIIDELNFSLNMEAGEIAVNLRQLYDFINSKLIEANIKKDAGILDQVSVLLNDLKSAWVELQNSKREAVAGE